jgi:predicted dehydrogenase
MLNMALIGIGYWGPNIARSFASTGKVTIQWLCDVNPTRLEKVAARYPEAKVTAELHRVLEDESIGAVSIATPTSTHYDIAKKALEYGKHVLIEKPIVTHSEQALHLIRLAQKHQKILMVGHVFEYNATVRALHNLIHSEELGELHYLNFERTNLGPIRTDVNVLWDLAPHDVSIMCYLLGKNPQHVTARGQAFLNAGIEDTVFSTFTFPNNIIAHVHVSWLNPRKIRQITVVGNKKMAVWNDLELRYPIQIYDKRIEEPADLHDTFLAYKTQVVDGGVYLPTIPINQPLQAECEHFIECIEQGCTPCSDGYSGLRVVLALEAATASMANNSVITPVHIPARETIFTS